MADYPVASVLVAITHDDGTLSIMTFVTADGRGINRLATADVVESEIAKLRAQQPELRAIKSWRFISRDDLPASRENRNAWRDDGTSIRAGTP
jgi:hypothetical protein